MVHGRPASPVSRRSGSLAAARRCRRNRLAALILHRREPTFIARAAISPDGSRAIHALSGQDAPGTGQTHHRPPCLAQICQSCQARRAIGKIRSTGSQALDMLRLAVGPASEFPSWQWVGADTARELAKYFDVSLFDSFKRIPTCDAVVIIKCRPPLRLARLLRETGVKVIFAPIDLYAAHAEIHRDMTLLEGCDLVLSHSELLLQHFQPYCKRVAHVEHHAKYTLPELAAYRPDGYVLWIGGLQYAPYLLDWLSRH